MSSESAGKRQMGGTGGDDRARTATAIKPAETSAASSADLESMLKRALVRIDSLERQHEEMKASAERQHEEMKASAERETRALKEDICRLREENEALRASTEREIKALRDESRPGGSTTMMQPRKRAKLSPSAALDALDNDLLVRCASYLDANGLAQLGRTSARFGITQPGQPRSLVNEAAHQQFRESTTDEERRCLPKHEDESDVGLCRALELLRRPLCFDELAGNGFGPQEHPSRLTGTGHSGWSTAVSGHVMRGGRHFVEFVINMAESLVEGLPVDVHLGVIRPVSLTDGIDLEAEWKRNAHPVRVSSSWKPEVAEKLRSQRTARWGESNFHCCTYYCYNGNCYWTDWDSENVFSDWQGQEGLPRSGTIGLLLDLDEGIMSVFKNGRRLGVIKEALGGEYCWFATAAIPSTIPTTISISRHSVMTLGGRGAGRGRNRALTGRGVRPGLPTTGVRRPFRLDEYPVPTGFLSRRGRFIVVEHPRHRPPSSTVRTSRGSVTSFPSNLSIINLHLLIVYAGRPSAASRYPACPDVAVPGGSASTGREMTHHWPPPPTGLGAVDRIASRRCATARRGQKSVEARASRADGGPGSHPRSIPGPFTDPTGCRAAFGIGGMGPLRREGTTRLPRGCPTAGGAMRGRICSPSARSRRKGSDPLSALGSTPDSTPLHRQGASHQVAPSPSSAGHCIRSRG
ncbi:hypothetical protein THAOC_01526, partial [Thalassiosira oceanica]